MPLQHLVVELGVVQQAVGQRCYEGSRDGQLLGFIPEQFGAVGADGHALGILADDEGIFPLLKGGVVQIRVTPKMRNPFTIKAISISGVTWKGQF
jgi:hypothetical protein